MKLSQRWNLCLLTYIVYVCIHVHVILYCMYNIQVCTHTCTSTCTNVYILVFTLISCVELYIHVERVFSMCSTCTLYMVHVHVHVYIMHVHVHTQLICLYMKTTCIHHNCHVVSMLIVRTCTCTCTCTCIINVMFSIIIHISQQFTFANISSPPLWCAFSLSPPRPNS